MADHIFRAAVVDSAGRSISGVWQLLSHGDEIDVSSLDHRRRDHGGLESGQSTLGMTASRWSLFE